MGAWVNRYITGRSPGLLTYGQLYYLKHGHGKWGRVLWETWGQIHYLNHPASLVVSSNLGVRGKKACEPTPSSLHKSMLVSQSSRESPVADYNCSDSRWQWSYPTQRELTDVHHQGSSSSSIHTTPVSLVTMTNARENHLQEKKVYLGSQLGSW